MNSLIGSFDGYTEDRKLVNRMSKRKTCLVNRVGRADVPHIL